MVTVCTVKRCVSFGILVLVLLTVWASEGRAELYGFSVVADDDSNPTDAAIGEAQLTVAVTAHAAGQVLFTLSNAVGGAPCTIKEVYFEDGALLAMASVINSPGVNFSGGAASPGDLPGGSSLSFPFSVTAGFLAEASGNNGTGVDPGESVGIVFNLKNNYGLAEVIAAIDQGLIAPNPSGASYYDSSLPASLRIGIHVGNFVGGGSESFINGGVVPVPGAMLLGSLGLGVASYRLRRKRA